MNIQKLKEVVTSEAKTEAKNLIDKTKKSIDEELSAFMSDLLQRDKTQKDHLENDFHGRTNRMKFQADSDYKKQILHMRHDLILRVQKKLLAVYIKDIKENPSAYLQKMNQVLPGKGDLYCSSELLDVFESEKNAEFETNYSFKGVDSLIEPGIACIDGRVKYIYPLQETIQDFLDENKNTIGKKLFDE